MRLLFVCQRCKLEKRTWSSSRVFGGRYLLNQKLVFFIKFFWYVGYTGLLLVCGIYRITIGMWDIHSITIGVWDIQDYHWYVGYTELPLVCGVYLVCGIYSITIGMWDIQDYHWYVGYTGLLLVCGI